MGDEAEMDISSLVERVSSPVRDVAMAAKLHEWDDNLLGLWPGGVGGIQVLQGAGDIQTREPRWSGVT